MQIYNIVSQFWKRLRLESSPVVGDVDNVKLPAMLAMEGPVMKERK